MFGVCGMDDERCVRGVGVLVIEGHVTCDTDQPRTHNNYLLT